MELIDKWLIDTLQKNKDVPFVKRILNTNYEPLDMGTDDEGRSMEATHLMSYSEADGEFFVYPEVIMGRNGQLKELSPEKAWQSAQNTGNYIVFKKESEAKWFSKNYKKVWNDLSSITGLTSPKKLVNNGPTPKEIIGSALKKGVSLNTMGYSVELSNPEQSKWLKDRPDIPAIFKGKKIYLNQSAKKPNGRYFTGKELGEAVVNEALRLSMQESGFNPVFKVTPKQQEFVEGTEYGKPENISHLKQSIIAKIMTNDKSAGDITPEQRTVADSFKNKLIDERKWPPDFNVFRA